MSEGYLSWLRKSSATYQSDIRNGVLPICNIRISTKKPKGVGYPTPTDRSLGAALKRRRLDLGLTQKEVARSFGIRKDSYQTFEWNEYIPHISKRKMINEFLGYNRWDDGSDTLKNRCLCFRIEKGLTMTQLADIIGVSRGTIERVENEITISEQMFQKVVNFIFS